MIMYMYVSYPAPQSSVTAGGPTFVSAMKDPRSTPLSGASVSWIHTWVLTQIQSTPHGSTPILPQALLGKRG